MADWTAGEKQYCGKKVLVLGAARSGISAAHLLLKFGASVVLNDRKNAHEDEMWPKELEALGVEVILGEHPHDLMDRDFDYIVKNPGIPYSHPYVQLALSRNIPVITEIELGFSIFEGICIGITGSNGKTTTTTLVGEMFSRWNEQTIIAGNIGQVFSEQVQQSTPQSVMVTELSSFQLKGTIQFRPHIACLLNIYSHHLDYHQTMEDYIESKFRLFANQTREDYAVLNWDQPLIRNRADELSAQVYGFSRHQELECGSFIQERMENGRRQKWIMFQDLDKPVEPILPIDEVVLFGDFNLENVLASVAIARIGGVPKDIIGEVLRMFRGVEHRLEFVAEKGGVRYYNNSKATNPEATEKALKCFDQPLILIAGGLDRGNSFDELLEEFSHKVSILIAYGQTREKLKELAERAGVKEIILVDNVTEGAFAAANKAKPGDIVLLSPACASWDLYSSFEERGRMFKEAVHSL